jgi:hypothetical protein
VITEQDLQEAIAECKGKRNPDSSTCIKLAAFLIIQEHLYGNPSESETTSALPAYSYAAPPEQVETIIDYQSDTEFSAVIDGRRADDVWPVMEELMEVLRRTNKPLYNATIRKIQD